MVWDSSSAVSSAGISWTTTWVPSTSGSGDAMTMVPSGPRSIVTWWSTVIS